MKLTFTNEDEAILPRVHERKALRTVNSWIAARATL